MLGNQREREKERDGFVGMCVSYEWMKNLRVGDWRVFALLGCSLRILVQEKNNNNNNKYIYIYIYIIVMMIYDIYYL